MKINMGWVMVVSAILTLPCYTLLNQLGQSLPVWTHYITVAGFVLGIPLIFIENWIHQDNEEKLR